MNDHELTPSDDNAPAAPPATPPANGTAANPVQDIRAQAAAEVERIAAIRRICAGKNAALEARAIRDGWDAQRAELEVLRATRPAAPAVHTPDNTVNTHVLDPRRRRLQASRLSAEPRLRRVGGGVG